MRCKNKNKNKNKNKKKSSECTNGTRRNRSKILCDETLWSWDVWFAGLQGATAL